MSEFTMQELIESVGRLYAQVQEPGGIKVPRHVHLALCRAQWADSQRFGGVTLSEAVAIMTLPNREFERWVWA